MDVKRRQDGQREGLPNSLARGIIGQKVQKQGEEPSRAVEGLCQRKDLVWPLQSWRKRAQEDVGRGAIGKGVGSTREGEEEGAAEMEGVEGREREDAGIPLQPKCSGWQKVGQIQVAAPERRSVLS